MERERYERFLPNERPKYIPMKHEDVERLSPEDRQEYENSKAYTCVINNRPLVNHTFAIVRFRSS